MQMGNNHRLVYTFWFLCAILIVAADPFFNCSKPHAEQVSASYRCPCDVVGTAEDDRPMLWVHVPKTGTSFANAVFRMACKKLPYWASIRTNKNVSGLKQVLVPYFSKCFHKEVKACLLEGGAKANTAHHPLEREGFDPQRVAYVTMLRDPISRLVSGFHHNMHDCHNCTKKTTLTEYAATTSGMYTDYFAGSDSTEIAIKRIQQFAFVGLMEYWDLSICLFHHLFGGRAPIEAEFANLRPGKYRRKKHALSMAAKEIERLQHALPAHFRSRLIDDNKVYAAGAVKFWSDVDRYRSNCTR